MKILVIEDEIDLANSLKKNLESVGIEIQTAHDGETGLNYAIENNYDLILLDWKIPKMQGIEVCKTIRNRNNFTPIILLTALSDVINKIQAFETGADDYITKPFDFNELLARINAIVRRSKNYSDTINFYSYKLQISKRKLMSNNIEIKLTDKEFDLLFYLLNHRNQIISKETLSNEVWQTPYFPNTNFIEATIKNLRKKIENNSSQKFIKNIYGEGYIFILD